jgi:hypothetical protein
VKKTYVKPTIVDLTMPSAHADTTDGLCENGNRVGQGSGFCAGGTGPTNPTSCGGGNGPDPQQYCDSGIAAT